MPDDSPQPNVDGSRNSLGFSPRFWIVVLATGVATGLAAGLLMKLLRFVQHRSFDYTTGNFLQGVEGTSAAHRVLVLLGAGLLAAAALWLIHRYMGKGEGLSAAIWFESGRLPTLKTLANGVLSITIVGMGAPLGREAAPKEAGAAMASRMARWARLNRAERRLLAACGAGAGIAAVYNLPFGGALFGLEVLLGSVEMTMVVPALLTSLVATSVSWLMLPDRATYTVAAYAFSMRELVFAAVAGPLIGFACVPYIRLISWASTHKPEKWRALALPPLVLCAVGVLSIWFPQLLGNGRNIVEGLLGAPPEIRMGLPLLFALAFLRPLATAGALRAGAPGGLFTPTMTFGAILGGLSGRFFEYFWPGEPSGVYALLGSGAALAAATQGPASALVMILELTRWTDPIMVPLMLAVATATFATRLFESRSIYSGRLEILFPAGSEGAAEPAPAERRHAVSAAARYPTVLEKMLALPPDVPGLLVLDRRGCVSGFIGRDSIQQSASEYGDPRETATAYDLATRIGGAPRPSGTPDLVQASQELR